MDEGSPGRRAPSVAIVTDVVRDGDAFHARHHSDVVLAGEVQKRMPETRVVLCDWRSLLPGDGDGGTFRALEAEGGAAPPVAVDRSVILAHVLRVGYGATRGSPLREKWSSFYGALDVFERAGVPVVNGYRALRAGHEKTYLRALDDAGVPVVPSEFWPTDAPLEEVRANRAGDAWVVKPANGECGRFVGRLDAVGEEEWRRLREHAALAVVQPFMRRIDEGEVSLVLVQGQIVHSVLKLPSPGGFLSNGQHVGATWREHAWSEDEAAVARAAAAAFPGHPELCRVDLVRGEGGPVVMEVEVVDPGFLGMPRPALARLLARLYRSRAPESR
jgi:glutathione synthase/RimK-type ligase-like ATP-grasp enzyme